MIVEGKARGDMFGESAAVESGEAKATGQHINTGSRARPRSPGVFVVSHRYILGLRPSLEVSDKTHSVPLKRVRCLFRRGALSLAWTVCTVSQRGFQEASL